MNYDFSPEFEKELKRYKKKYLSLDRDLDLFCKVLEQFPEGNSNHFTALFKSEDFVIVKARLFCRYLKKSSLRTIYVYSCSVKKILFIELYFKGDKENEDRERIKEYIKIYNK